MLRVRCLIDELNDKLQYNDKESKIFMPNEIFKDLQASGIKNKHIPLAYSYYYLICWLYRYAKYGAMNDIDNKKIKEILGYSPTYPEIDYIIKKNGTLDQIGYTITVKDFPLLWTYEDDFLDFDLLSDMDEDTQRVVKQQYSRKYSVKFPPKAFHRTKESEDDSYLDGTFYEVDNTHLIPFEVFAFCMSKKELECMGFYLWSYLKMQNQMFNGGYDISLDDLAVDTKIPRSTMCVYLNALREYGMINCYHNQEYFSFGLSDDEKKANTYVTTEWNEFIDDRKSVSKLRFVSVKEHEEIKENKDGLVELFG